ncbi:MAG: hypothetical protein IIB00_09915, partial [candidate division Zixibacteria bacterium]|nr:hypothetical protein [candidate division Zixibacteria bacterium]
MKQENPAVVADQLKSLFLCCSSPMSASINTLLKASRFRLKLEIGGHKNPGYRLFVTMAKRLEVDIEEVEVKSKNRHKPYVWLSDHSTPNQRAWIPEMQHRESDFHVMLPFYLRYHLTELRKHEPEFPAPRVDNLYLTLLWEICFDYRNVPLSARVLKDLLAWERVTVLTAHNYINPVGEEIPIVSSKVSSLSNFAQMYLGFWSGNDAWKIIHGKEIERHSLNARSRKFLNILQPGTGANVRYPVFVRQYSWDIDQLLTIAKNSWALNSYRIQRSAEDIAKLQRCLLLRLQAKSEEEIRAELGFSEQESYCKWQIKNMISQDSGILRDPFEAWLQACEFFGFEPSGELLDQVTGQDSSSIQEPSRQSQADDPDSSLNVENGKTRSDLEQTGKSLNEPLPNRGFRHGPDYRSVVAANEKQFSLTAKQSDVIRILHENQQNGTPDVSRGYVVQEAYGNVSENSLKKLFDNNKA